MISTEDLVAHMRRVLVAERDLHDLGLVWTLIESSAAISCPAEVAPILPTLIKTRERFDQLRGRLIDQMSSEFKAALAGELGSAAQCVIDILVRNLFERTADVGFLASDGDVGAFCLDPTPAAAGKLRERLKEYQAKYTVYDDVTCFAPGGELLVRLAQDEGDNLTADPEVLREALSRRGYVEAFGAFGQAGKLFYAHKIEHRGRAVGVLVLRFRFLDELQRIFEKVLGDQQRIACMLVDQSGRVVASSDEEHVALGTRIRAQCSSDLELVTHAGREYMAFSCKGTGYQGYPGPGGWRAVAMVPLLTAFNQASSRPGEDVGSFVQARHELAAIQEGASEINRELCRVVWNGRVMASEHSGDRLRLTAVLQQVNDAGVRTRARVDQSIQEIGASALQRSRQQAIEMARLMVDIMDRNLYERANDCRWWALSPAVAQALAGESACNDVLDHINGLYTVYSRLVVFDLQGRVRGVSRADAEGFAQSEHVAAAWVEAVRGLRDSQAYAVTPFEDTNWHDGGPTFTYLAAIREPGASKRLLGGIGIVFNAAGELKAMLGDLLVGEGLAAFLDGSGQVIAHSGDHSPAAELLAFPGESALVEHEGVQYLCARVAATGYREFHQAAAGGRPPCAVVALPWGRVERRRGRISDRGIRSPGAATKTALQELALFNVGPGCYGVPIGALIEAAPQDGLVPTPGSDAIRAGLMEVSSGGGRSLVTVANARGLVGLTTPPRRGDGVVVVLRSPEDRERAVVGLRVDEVLSVVEVAEQAIQDAPGAVQAVSPWIRGLVKCPTASGADVLIQVIDPDALLTAIC